MAAPNQPTFPKPALDVGVAQYPTPIVPDFYTKNGDIILVVKESFEKGSYNPKPLDGSITYTGRDANKWPDTLYLVAQRPTEDGEYVYNFYANDRSLESQDIYNYGVEYSENNPDYPITSRQYIVPREQYEPVELGATDPVFGGDQIISQQKMVELPDENPLRSRYVAVQRIYETIPGPIVAGYQYDEFFEANLEISKQIVAAGAPPIAIENGLLSYKDEPVDSAKSQRVIVTTPSLPPTRTEYKTGTYQSPTLVFGIVTEAVNIACSGDQPDIRVRLTPNTRAAQSKQTTFKTITSYSYGPPEPGDTDLFNPVPKLVAYTGYVINFNLGGALCDEIQSLFAYKTWNGSEVITTYLEQIPAHYCNDGFGNLVPNVYENWLIEPTSPTATEYLAVIGTYQKISWESRYWKSGIWENKEIWVKLI